MKAFNIRLPDMTLNWILSFARKRRVTQTEIVREAIQEKMIRELKKAKKKK